MGHLRSRSYATLSRVSSKEVSSSRSSSENDAPSRWSKMKQSTKFIVYGAAAFVGYSLLSSRGSAAKPAPPTPPTESPLPTLLEVCYGPIEGSDNVVFKMDYSTGVPARYASTYIIGAQNQSGFYQAPKTSMVKVNGMNASAFSKSGAISKLKALAQPAQPSGPQIEPPTTQPARPNDNSRPSFGFGAGHKPAQGW